MELDPTEQQAVVVRFLAAAKTGDLQGLMEVLAPDVVLIADGGGLAPTARRPVVGARSVANLLKAYAARGVEARIENVWLNAAPGFLVEVAGELDQAVGVTVADGRISRIYMIRNPHKLTQLADVQPLSRAT